MCHSANQPRQATHCVAVCRHRQHVRKHAHTDQLFTHVEQQHGRSDRQCNFVALEKSGFYHPTSSTMPQDRAHTLEFWCLTPLRLSAVTALPFCNTHAETSALEQLASPLHMERDAPALPPGMMYFSSTSTLDPLAAICVAAVSPPTPLPMTIASHFLAASSGVRVGILIAVATAETGTCEVQLARFID
jgi:hypothetical protein